MLAEDIEAGGGDLKIRQSDVAKFEVGVNLATTPGKVVFRNETMELLQYAPTTETVLKRPLLICPPWINKFYVLDLNPEKSFIRWCGRAGPDRLRASPGSIPTSASATRASRNTCARGPSPRSTRSARSPARRRSRAIGYCVGGTLLGGHARLHGGQGRQAASPRATLFTTQVDFANAGDLKVFVDEEQIQTVERKMAEHGYLAGSKMAAAFNMLRSQDLIWPYVVSNYVRGKQPTAFDLLYWNSDSTRMPAENHSFYLRNCYLENNLSKGEMEVGGVRLDLGKVTGADLQSRHARGPYRAGEIGLRRLGPVRRAGALRAGRVGPHRRRRQPAGEARNTNTGPAGRPRALRGLARQGRGASGLVVAAIGSPGSTAQAPERIPATRRKPGGRRKTLGDAPGEYVKVRA